MRLKEAREWKGVKQKACLLQTIMSEQSMPLFTLLNALDYSTFAIKVVLLYCTVLAYRVRIKNWLQNKTITAYVTILLACGL
jgi:hypothetical protein